MILVLVAETSSTEELHSAELNPSQTLIVNCTEEEIPKDLRDKVLKFVKEGGQLITSDKALSAWISVLFPDMLTSRKVDDRLKVRGHYASVKVPKSVPPYSMIRDVISDEPPHLLWTVEAFSDIVAKRNAEVQKLLIAPRLRWTLNEDGILYYFKYGQGRVYHSVPHFFVQNYDDSWPKYLNSLPHIEDYLKSKNVNDAVLQLTRKYYHELGPKYINLSALRSTVTSLEVLCRAIALQKKNYNPVIVLSSTSVDNQTTPNEPPTTDSK